MPTIEAVSVLVAESTPTVGTDIFCAIVTYGTFTVVGFGFQKLLNVAEGAVWKDSRVHSSTTTTFYHFVKVFAEVYC